MPRRSQYRQRVASHRTITSHYVWLGCTHSLLGLSERPLEDFARQPHLSLYYLYDDYHNHNTEKLPPPNEHNPANPDISIVVSLFDIGGRFLVRIIPGIDLDIDFAISISLSLITSPSLTHTHTHPSYRSTWSLPSNRVCTATRYNASVSA